MSSYDIFVNSVWKSQIFLRICHMTIIFMEKKLYILLTPHNIYQKQKTESVYLIPKNNYGPFSETGIFPNFPLPQQQK